MKVYEYAPEELGFEDYTRYGRAWVDAEVTRDPDKADVFVVPCMIWELGIPDDKRNTMQPNYNLVPYLEGREDRHVFHCWGEFEHMETPKGSIAFRADCTDKVLERDPWTISWPWPVDDLWLQPVNGSPLPNIFSGFGAPYQYDVSFHGWARLPMQHRILEAVAQDDRINQDFRIDNRYWGTGVPADEQKILRENYVKSVWKSRFSLSVYNRYGVIRYRVYEAMTLGSTIFHVNDHCVYPLQDKIDWGVFVVRFDEGAHPQAIVSMMVDTLSRTTDSELLLRGSYGREMYDRWLNRDDWPKVKAEIIAERLRL